MQMGRVLNDLYLFSRWLDDNMPEHYRNNPLALKWLRTAKVGEESGEVIDALIASTGGNPRKTPEDGDEHLCRELADTALTGILALMHLLDSPAAVGNVLVMRVRLYLARMLTTGGKWPAGYDAAELWMWDEQRQYDDWLERMMARIPNCWDGDTAAENILENYLHRLEETHSQHAAWCDEANPLGH